MSQKPTRSKYTTLVQICQLIPTFLVSKLARQYGVDQGARKFSAWSHVVSLLYAQLSHALSLNDVCDALNNHSGKLRTLRGARAPKRNTLSNANRKRNPEMAEQVFWQTLQHLCEQSPGFGGRTYQGMPRRFKRMINVVDLYGCRWSIEVFFKELKQTLQLCDFLGHNKKAILWQVWTALLLYVLLRFLAFTHRWSHGFKRLFCLLRSSLWDAFLLRDLLKSYGTASGAIPLKPHVEQLWLPGFEPI